MRIAVVGTGVSGLVAARLLADEHDVYVFESETVVGGHALTVNAEAFKGLYPVDVGFMVYNESTYPNFTKLLKYLDVHTRKSDMSFSVRCDRTGQEYNGSSLDGFFARRSNLFRPSHLRMLRDVLRFFREASGEADELPIDETLGAYITRKGYGNEFQSLYLLPMAASIWSASPQSILEFPARFLIRFFRNHGLLQVVNHPAWRTIVGGSTVYVEAISQPYKNNIRIGTPVTAVVRTERGAIVVTEKRGEEPFDAVVMATHADITLRLLKDADTLETKVLSAFPYQENRAVLHIDSSLLPKRRRAWASWNYLVPANSALPVTITYDLCRLQGHVTPSPICLTLNRGTDVDPKKVLQEFTFHHPLFEPRSLAAQGRHEEINGSRNTYFCGAYWGNGFHEDGVNSALVVGRRFGKSLETCKAASTKVGLNTADSGRSFIASDAGFT